MDFKSAEQHNIEIQENIKYWKSKPVLQKIYKQYYELIAQQVRYDKKGKIVEIGSGIGNLKIVISDCLCTDIFPNPWVDQVENAYNLSFSDMCVSNLILFDVWHHLEYPGTVLQEFHRVLVPGGRLIIFEPALSLIGFIVYGLFHHEPIKYTKEIRWWASENFNPVNTNYYAAQGNATRIFFSNNYNKLLLDWKRVETKRLSSISYITSGGYSRKQLYPDSFFSVMSFIDRIFNYFPLLFATRLLVVLEKR